jgi:hypothetical protein
VELLLAHQVEFHLWSTSRDCKSPGLVVLPAGGVPALARAKRVRVSTLVTSTGIEDEKTLEGSFLWQQVWGIGQPYINAG